MLLEVVAEKTGYPVEMLGADSAEQASTLIQNELPDLYGCADAFAMLCRSRWLGLEQEGFGIAFLEAMAAGLPVVMGTRDRPEIRTVL